MDGAVGEGDIHTAGVVAAGRGAAERGDVVASGHNRVSPSFVQLNWLGVPKWLYDCHINQLGTAPIHCSALPQKRTNVRVGWSKPDTLATHRRLPSSAPLL